MPSPSLFSAKDDAFETPREALALLVPYLPPNAVLYDPFYCTGRVAKLWRSLGFRCIHERRNAFVRRRAPVACEVVVTNPPFSKKREVFALLHRLGRPFAVLVPLTTLGCNWFGPHRDRYEYVWPCGRIAFLKNGVPAKKAPFYSLWVCYGLHVGGG